MGGGSPRRRQAPVMAGGVVGRAQSTTCGAPLVPIRRRPPPWPSCRSAGQSTGGGSVRRQRRLLPTGRDTVLPSSPDLRELLPMAGGRGNSRGQLGPRRRRSRRGRTGHPGARRRLDTGSRERTAACASGGGGRGRAGRRRAARCRHRGDGDRQGEVHAAAPTPTLGHPSPVAVPAAADRGHVERVGGRRWTPPRRPMRPTGGADGGVATVAAGHCFRTDRVGGSRGARRRAAGGAPRRRAGGRRGAR
ncbi:hypothetical protein BU14_2530s0001 [Porphyra umbilicalis]|uniref:Uncharacterized protein n=1 Tax=Porphyra umbilicalis TaxID=2786 RepID=A0A1X6NJ72_PORUM|nr:hypothetical protein BU14_2530s0001 [Porphyra umbilicalis]|eukprot:OSX68590.1 hypothetical protein BU14_2530s0001 [Porphyra umbilicalis]